MAETVSGSQVKPPSPSMPPSAPEPEQQIPKRDRDLLAMIDRGISYPEIAKHFKIAPQQVSKIALKYGVRRRAERGGEPEPRPFIGSPGAKAAGEKAAATRATKMQHDQIVTLFAVGFHSIYSLIAQFEGAHWEINEQEADDMAEPLKKALDTLEGEGYEHAIRILSRAAPWATLAVAIWSVTKPRIEQTTRERAAREVVERDKRERAAAFGVIRGGQDTRPNEQKGDPVSSVRSDEPNGQTAWPDAV